MEEIDHRARPENPNSREWEQKIEIEQRSTFEKMLESFEKQHIQKNNQE
jgi:hypothetical protein